MSIILKGNNISSNNDGIGPGEVTNIKASQNASSIILSWTNPSNVVIDGTTLSTFDHVIIVKNESRYPTSIKDGNTIYSGNGTTCSDGNVIKNKKYHYRFFVYDTNKLCNNNMSMIIENTFYGIDYSILKNNTWEQIAAASESGIASSLWKVGDEIDLTLSEFKYNDDEDMDEVYSFSAQTITLQIWDFNHFDKSDGSGKAGIVFGMKNLMKERFTGWHFSCWAESDIKKTLMTAIYNRLPEDCRSYIKPVKVYTAYNINYNGYGNPAGHSQSPGYLSIEKVFVPGLTEVGTALKNSLISTFNCELNQKQFPIFTDSNSRIKNPPSDGSTNIYNYLLRSSVDFEYDSIIRVWNHDGEPNSSRSTGSGDSFGLCFCFCI